MTSQIAGTAVKGLTRPSLLPCLQEKVNSMNALEKEIATFADIETKLDRQVK